jgi:hypothetical protein
MVKKDFKVKSNNNLSATKVAKKLIKNMTAN